MSGICPHLESCNSIRYQIHINELRYDQIGAELDPAKDIKDPVILEKLRAEAAQNRATDKDLRARKNGLSRCPSCPLNEIST